jgi:hypothetical protein
MPLGSITRVELGQKLNLAHNGINEKKSNNLKSKEGAKE